jgi:hypothetical protein
MLIYIISSWLIAHVKLLGRANTCRVEFAGAGDTHRQLGNRRYRYY